MLAPAPNPPPDALNPLTADLQSLEDLLHRNLLAASLKAVERLRSLLEATSDPLEIRQVSAILSRFFRLARPKALKDSAGSEPPRPSPAPTTKTTPPPSNPPPDSPLQPALSSSLPLTRGPIPSPVPDPLRLPPSATPKDVIAAQLQAIAESPSPQHATEILRPTIAPSAPDALARFTAALAASPAWTCRDRIPQISPAAISGAIAKLRVAFPSARGPAYTCIFHLASDLSRGDPRWLTTDITINTT